MPYVVTALTYVAEFIYYGLTASGLYGAVFRAVATIALSAATSRLNNRGEAGPSSFSGLQQTTRSALEYKKIIYGEALVSGPIIYSNVTADNNSVLDIAVAMAGHEVDSYVGWYIDDVYVPLSDLQGQNITTPAFIGENSSNAAGLQANLGTTTQAADSILNGSYTEWTSAHRLRGIAYVVFRFTYTWETAEVWEKGVPQRLAALIKGRKIYDPRLDSTNGGTGSHRYTDASTWEWSDNPSLCLADYLVSYMNSDPAEDIDWPSVITAADACDVLVDIPDGAGGSEQQKRFTCNGAITEGESHTNNIESLLSSFDGVLSWSGGVWSIRASVWVAPTETIDENMLSGHEVVRGHAPASERYNVVTGFYIDPNRDYQAVEFQPAESAEFLARDDGEELPFDLELPFTNNEYMAQRIAYRRLEQFDNQIVATLPLNLQGLKFKSGTVYNHNFDKYGWVNKTFRVFKWVPLENGGYEITATEDYESRYVDPAVGDYSTKDAAGVVTPPTQTVPPPTGLAASASEAGVFLNWSNPAGRLFEWVDVYRSVDADRSNAVKVGETRSNTFLHNSNSSGYYWIQARSFNSRVSDFEPNNTTGVFGSSVRTFFSDPNVSDSAAWTSDYTVGVGIGGKDAIQVTGTSIAQQVYRTFNSVAELPEWIEGGVVEISTRCYVDDTAAVTVFGILPEFNIYDANGVFMGAYRDNDGGLSVDESGNNQWNTLNSLVELREADVFPLPTGPKPWYIQSGFNFLTNLLAPIATIDRVDGVYLGKSFSGAESGLSKGGVIPKISGAVDGKVLSDNGWAYPEKGDVRNFGAVGDGVTDDTAAIQAAFDSIPSTGGDIVFKPGEYLMDGTTDHPLLSTTLYTQGNTARFTDSIGVLISNKNNINVFMEGASIKWTNTSSNECGAITFYNCNNVNVYGGNFDGVTGGASLFMVLGDCTGARFFGLQASGGRALCCIESDDRTATTTNRPKDVHVSGSASGTTYGAFIFAGNDISVDIKVHNVTRALWIGSVRSLIGSVTGDTTSGAALNINPREGDTLDGLDLNVDLTDTNQGALIRQWDNTPSSGTTLKNVKLRGRISNRASDGQPVVQITSLLNTGTVFENIDLSDLRIEYVDRTGSAASAPYALYINPDVAGTIKNINVGDITCPQDGQTNRAFSMVNTPDATIESIRFIGKRLISEDECIFATATSAGKGGVDVEIIGCQFNRNSSGNPVRWARADFIQCSDNRANKATIDLQNSTNISGKNNVITGVSPYRSGALADSTYSAWTEIYELTSGSATINDITGTPGQELTLFANGGTPTLNHATTKLNLDSDSNFTLALRNSITLRCIDGLRWVEVCRKT